MMTQEEDNRDSSTASLVFDKPLHTKHGNIVFLDQYNLHLEPFETQHVTISLKTLRPEEVQEFFEVMIRNGQSQFF